MKKQWKYRLPDDMGREGNEISSWLPSHNFWVLQSVPYWKHMFETINWTKKFTLVGMCHILHMHKKGKIPYLVRHSKILSLHWDHSTIKGDKLTNNLLIWLTGLPPCFCPSHYNTPHVPHSGCLHLKRWTAASQLFANKTLSFVLLEIITSIVMFKFSEK